MKRSGWRYSRCALGLLGVVVALAAIHWLVGSGLLQPGVAEAQVIPGPGLSEPMPGGLDRSNPEVQAAMAAQHRHNRHLLALPEVLGTATGVNEAGKPSIKVFIKRNVSPGLIPGSLDGIPVAIEVTGEIFAMNLVTKAAKYDPRQRFTRPVPIGVSTGNEDECSAGTIAARVKDAQGNLFALSNNHVYALGNEAPTSSRVLQPGRYDTFCSLNADDAIGVLADFATIDFTGADNTIDAAIASVNLLPDGSPMLDNRTPANGYGRPKSANREAKLHQAVQKYGRTTSKTNGKVTGINATIQVSYPTGTATFVNQIVVKSTKPFIEPGDSGSLLVTRSGKKPVGLLFAGDSTGTYAIANPINEVLARFGVTIDGK
jgi:hypothetical protein